MSMSRRERLTQRIFLTVQVVLVAIPFVYLGMSGVLNLGGGSIETLQEQLRAHPAFLVMFISSCLQPLAAYLVRIAQRHYYADDAGYTVGNLVGLLCAEMLMQNMVGIVGMALLLWRTWPAGSDALAPWARARRVPGVLADISGALVLCSLAALLAFVSWRIG